MKVPLSVMRRARRHAQIVGRNTAVMRHRKTWHWHSDPARLPIGGRLVCVVESSPTWTTAFAEQAGRVA
jgi:hypothetical protein